MTAIAPKQIGLDATIADLATGGAVTLPNSTRAEQYRVIAINQTTASQTITLPAPTDTSVRFSLDILNVGTASFTMYGVAISAGGATTMHWNGTAWTQDVAGATPVVPTEQNLVPTAQNTVPKLSSAPKAGYPVRFYVNGQFVPNGIVTDASGNVTVTSATVGFNIETTDRVDVLYYI